MRVSDLPRAWRVGFDEVAELYDKVRPGFPDDLFDELATHCLRPRPSSKLVRNGPGDEGPRCPRSQGDCGRVGSAPRSRSRSKSPDRGSRRRGLRRSGPCVGLVRRCRSGEQLPLGAARGADDPAGGSPSTRRPPRPDCPQPGRFSRRPGVLRRSPHVFSRRGQPGTHEPVPTHDELVPSFVDEIAASAEFTDLSVHRYRWDQRYTARGYTELKRTDSNNRGMADAEAREAMLAEVEALIDSRYDGWIVRPLTASLVLARRR